jgi:hypothetical protein
MSFSRFLLGLFLLSLVAHDASAGIFGKHTKPNPAERVPELLATLKTDQDESKRAKAAAELRDYDPSTFPDLVPGLIDALQHDAKSAVRSEAVQSLGKLRPISQEAGAALEEAAHDSSMRVRLQARSSLLSYRLAGYHSAPKTTEPPARAKSESAKKPLTPVVQAKPKAVPPAPRTGAMVHPMETPPPPLAEPPVAPQGKSPPTAEPDQGPDLPPPQETGKPPEE